MSITPPGRLVLLGHPVAQSLSPTFQNAALRAAGIPLTYEALDTSPDELVETLASLRAARAAGNVTVPHKIAVAARCDRLTLLASRLGAVNTFWHDSDALVGDNTDVAGFDALADSLGVERSGAVVACIGAGGAARAACAAIEHWHGASVRIWSRREGAALAIERRFATIATAARTQADALAGATVVVNATPLGMGDDSLPVDVAQIPRDARVMDLVYRRGETHWVRSARAAGFRAADGREMLLWQGVWAFRRWFGESPNIEVMREALMQGAKMS